MASLKEIDGRIKSTKNETNYQSDEYGIKFKITSSWKNTKQFEPYMEKMQDAITAIAGASKILVIPCLDLDKFNVVAT